MSRRMIPLSACLVLLAFACDGVSEPAQPELSPAMSFTGADLDVAGAWEWSETTVLALRAPAVALFGIAAEGPVTHLECQSSGLLSIAQNGATFSGVASQSSTCTTRDGHTFDPAPIFPAAWTMAGEIAGRSIDFVVQAGGFPCSYRGSAQVRSGAVASLHANGSCAVPKELGNDHILGWTAVRP